MSHEQGLVDVYLYGMFTGFVNCAVHEGGATPDEAYSWALMQLRNLRDNMPLLDDPDLVSQLETAYLCDGALPFLGTQTVIPLAKAHDFHCTLRTLSNADHMTCACSCHE